RAVGQKLHAAAGDLAIDEIAVVAAAARPGQGAAARAAAITEFARVAITVVPFDGAGAFDPAAAKADGIGSIRRAGDRDGERPGPRGAPADTSPAPAEGGRVAQPRQEGAAAIGAVGDPAVKPGGILPLAGAGPQDQHRHDADPRRWPYHRSLPRLRP